MRNLLTLGAHAQGGGYGTCLVCLCVSVCYHSSTNIAHLYAENKACQGCNLGCSWFLMHRFLINHSVLKLWREKANIQVSMYLSQPVLAGFEYRAYISR